MHPYRHFVAETARLLREARACPHGGYPPAPRPREAPPCPPGGSPPPPRPALATDAPRALLFSPHPDDECITGALPLRLLRESGMRVIDVAVTQGGNKQRQEPRLDELRA